MFTKSIYIVQRNKYIKQQYHKIKIKEDIKPKRVVSVLQTHYTVDAYK